MNIVLDAMGVIYKTGDDVSELLIPFLRRKGCVFSDPKIETSYIECSLGKYSSGIFWGKMGFHENVDILEDEYLDGHHLVDGLPGFLEETQRKGLTVSVISNDVSEWSLKLRERFNLHKAISHWCISGDVGKRKPDESIYTYFLGMTGFNSKDCIFIDDRVKNLAPAKILGFHTVLFDADKIIGDTAEHDAVTGFNELNALIFGKFANQPD